MYMFCVCGCYLYVSTLYVGKCYTCDVRVCVLCVSECDVGVCSVYVGIRCGLKSILSRGCLLHSAEVIIRACWIWQSPLLLSAPLALCASRIIPLTF